MSFSHIKSDVLPQLAKNFQAEWLKPYWKVRRTPVVLDANIALTEVAWMARRNRLTGRTDLREVLCNGTLVAHAPTFLKKEMEKKIPIYAKKRKISPEKMFLEWDILQNFLRFHDEGGADSKFGRDHKDAPYVSLAIRLKTRVLTLDADIEAMGAPVLARETIGEIKLYSRHAATEHHLKFAGLTTSGMLLPLAGKVGAELWRKHPWLTLITLVGISAYALSNPTRRERIHSALKTIGNLGLQSFDAYSKAKAQANCNSSLPHRYRWQRRHLLPHPRSGNHGSNVFP